jgi:S-adenosylmethionine hydrolase
MKRPVISLVTDFGLADHYVGAMKGVMLGICPAAQFVDISHEITAFAIADGAFTVAQSWPYFPRGTVHLIVVDPGVGSRRRPILAEAGGHRFVAPDNGVLSMVFEAVSKHKVREISDSRYFRKPVSRTFHGRDIFAPVAAHLAAGVAPARFGKRIEDYVRLPDSGCDGKRGIVLHIDHFGNAVTSFRSEDQPGRFEIRIGGRRISRIATNYAEVEGGELFVIAGSAGYLEISMNRASAAEALGIRAGATVELESFQD